MSEDTPLFQNIKSGDWKIRQETYQSLKKEEITPEILKILAKETNIPVLETALSLILDIKPPILHPYITPILLNLGTPKLTLKSKICDVVFYILEKQNTEITQDLISLLTSKNPKLVANTLQLLLQITTDYGLIYDVSSLNLPILLQHADKNVRKWTFDLTVEIYKTYKNNLLPLISDVKPIILKELQQQFTMAGSPAIKKKIPHDTQLDTNFLELLNSTDWKERVKALQLLVAHLNHSSITPDTVKALIKKLRDPNLQVITHVLDCLSFISKDNVYNRKELINMLCLLFREKKSVVVEKVFKVLKKTETEENEIVEFLNTKNSNVKVNILEYLVSVVNNKRHGFSVECVNDIVVCLEDYSSDVRNKAISLLGVIMVYNKERIEGVINTVEKIKGNKIREVYSKLEGDSNRDSKSNRLEGVNIRDNKNNKLEGVNIRDNKNNKLEGVNDRSNKLEGDNDRSNKLEGVNIGDGKNNKLEGVNIGDGNMGGVSNSNNIKCNIKGVSNTDNNTSNTTTDTNTSYNNNILTPPVNKRKLTTSSILKKSTSNRKTKDGKNMEEYFTDIFINKVSTVRSKEDCYSIIQLYNTTDIISISDYVLSFVVNNNLIENIKPLLLYFIDKSYILSTYEVTVLIRYLIGVNDKELFKLLDKVYPISKLFLMYEKHVYLDSKVVSMEVGRLISLHGVFKGDISKYDREYVGCYDDIECDGGVNTKGSLIEGVNYVDSKLEGVNTVHGNIMGVNTLHSKLEGVNYLDSKLEGVTTVDSNIMGGNTLHSKLEGVNYLDSNIMGVNILDSNIMGVSYSINEQRDNINSNLRFKSINNNSVSYSPLNKKTKEITPIDSNSNIYSNNPLFGVNNMSDSLCSDALNESFSILNIKEEKVNNNSILEGVNNKDTRVEGVNTVDSNIKGVNNSTSKQQGVSTVTSKLEGVNTIYSSVKRVNSTTDNNTIPSVNTTVINTPSTTDNISKFRNEFINPVNSYKDTNIITRLIDSNVDNTVTTFKQLNSIIDTNITYLLFSCNSIVSSILIQFSECHRKKRTQICVYILNTLLKLSKNTSFTSYLSRDTLKTLHIDLLCFINSREYSKVVSDILINICLLCDSDIILYIYLNMIDNSSEVEGVSNKDSSIKDMGGVSNSTNNYKGVNNKDNRLEGVNVRDILLKLIWRNSKTRGYLQSRIKTQSVLNVLYEFYEKGILRIFKDDYVALRVIQLHLEEIVIYYGSDVYSFNVNGLLRVYVDNIYKRIVKNDNNEVNR